MYKYVYSLSCEGVVFYIGCTKDVYARYKQHLKQTWLPTDTSKHIGKLLSNNIYPKLTIIDYLPEFDALTKEATLVKTFTNAGHKLTNFQWCNQRASNKEVKAISLKTAFEIVKKATDDFIKYNNRYGYKTPNK